MTATDRYKGEDGGLYGGGRNLPPTPILQAAVNAAARLQPLGRDGTPDPRGRIVFFSLGMSNTTQEFQAFLPLAQADDQRARAVQAVDGAQGGCDAAAYVAQDRVWQMSDERLRNAGCTPQQVQVAWLKQALAGPGRLGAYPAHADKLREDLVFIVQKAHQRYPNLKLVYLSSRIYAGYATTQLNPEPYAYEGAFAVRRLLLDQYAGQAELNWDPAKGEVRAPLLLWGPYLWANGGTPRVDGLTWQRSDLRADDGTHPSEAGRQKVAKLLLDFCHQDPTAAGWYLAR